MSDTFEPGTPPEEPAHDGHPELPDPGAGRADLPLFTPPPAPPQGPYPAGPPAGPPPGLQPPYPPGATPYPPGSAAYAPGTAAYPPGTAAYPPGASPYPPGGNDTWLRPPPPAGPGTGPGGTGAPPPPWDTAGHWGQPGGWGAPVWLPPPPPTRPNPMRVLAVALVALLIAVVGVAVGRTSIISPSGSLGGGSPATSTANGGAATIAAKVDPGVVDVTSQLGQGGGEAAGTGMVLTSGGEVLTNNHVIDGATSVTVTDVGNGQTYSATVVGTDATDDVAVLQLQGASGLHTISTGDSSTLAVGAELTAIGNAGGVGGTPSVATGTVTALDQSITASDESDGSSEQLSGLIQTDAPLEPGDSGGPLVESDGKVIGMDTAASSGFTLQSGQSEGFSIPIDKALSIARQIAAGHGSATIHIGPAALIGVDVQPEPGTTGAPVVGVEAGSPADDAGIVAGDVIVAVGGQSVDSTTALRNIMSRHHPGDRVQVEWTDQSGSNHIATVQLVTGPAT